MQFPEGFGDFRGKTFEEIFSTDPKNTEFVYKCWDGDSCSGIFKDLYDFVCERMQIPAEKAAHVERCKEYCQTNDEVPNYLAKYK